MPSTENSGTSSPLAAFGRSIWSFRREQVHSMETNQDSSVLESELEFFQQRVTERFQDLSSAGNDELLSIPWIQKLLDAFNSSLEDFRVILLNNKAEVSKPPLERLVDDFFERIVKALDICNATCDGIEKIRSWHKLLDIVVCALDSKKRALSEGQFRRARKALVDLALVMLDERDTGSVFSHRNMSFGRHNTKKDHHSHHRNQSSGHSRSLSWSVSNSWSAAKQLQSIATNLIPPRGNEIVATNGLAVPVFTMSFVLMFVLWTLVAAIPCQDRGLNVHFSVPPQLLMGNAFDVERCARHMTDLVDSVQFPLTEEQKEEVEQRVHEVAAVCESFRNGLDPLERQLREVFRRIMNCRTEGHDILNRGKNDLD
ncbi:hypothetical protein G4B88_004987 [Cannabis sativa]|uniref:Uncharacterized protein n=1 Tax=Cannabis sativa TaxID=3483 RepID=A0A7J6E081_CANSA|nr:hypothetical protein G4B88_004987 [Cannabis sativa]